MDSYFVDRRWYVRFVSISAWLALFAASAAGAASDPQVAALQTLHRNSAIPLHVSFAAGTARAVSLDVAAEGRTPVEQARNFLAAYGDLFLRNDDPVSLEAGRFVGSELVARGVYPSEGAQVVLFAQRIGGLPVVGGDLAIMVGSSPRGRKRILSATGALLPATLRDLDLIPAIDETQAIAAAAQHLERTNSEVLAGPELVVWSDRINGNRAPVLLAWSMVLGGGHARRVLVDANDVDGEVLLDYPLSATGADDDYALDFEDANGDFITSTACFDATTNDDQIGDENGISSAYLNDPDATTEWWHLRRTYLYYHNRLGRHSFDDDGAEVLAYIHSGFDTNNARFVPECSSFEFNDGMISLDVTGHEFTHAVINRSPSNLIYQGTSGAINESFADLMGELSDPGADWLCAEDALNGNGAIRSMKDPGGVECGPPAAPFACGDPDRSSAFVTTTADDGGVHTNSGIPNKASFLMADGGTFNGVDVGTGMGREKLERLAYHVMRFLPSSATFRNVLDSYVATARAWAEDDNYNGFTLLDVCTIRNAWAAVEVGNPDSDCDGLTDNIDDSDGDGLWGSGVFGTPFDNCPNANNPGQEDWDNDGLGDACDDDNDNDGCTDDLDKCPGVDDGPCFGYPTLDFDNDGDGNNCDTDDDNDGIADDADNCPVDANPDQADGNHDGFGDACDPDYDGDGIFGADDNCTFVANANQFDTDRDGIGDACDLCPNVADSQQAYTPGFPELGIPPKPVQPDSDDDGIPDACDELAFGDLGVSIDDLPVNPRNPLRPSGGDRSIKVAGNGKFSIPLPGCEGDAGILPAKQRIEMTVEGLANSAGLELWIANGLGVRVARLSSANEKGVRGMRYRPDCGEQYTLRGQTTGRFPGQVTFTLRSRIASAGKRNPWAGSSWVESGTLPPPLSDVDRDGIVDFLDNCADVFNPAQKDSDGNGRGDACSDFCDPDDCSTEVALDVRSGGKSNLVDPHSRGKLKVAVLSNEDIDATEIEPQSILVSGAPLRSGRRGLPLKRQDVNRDGRLDLVVMVPIPATDLNEYDDKVTLVARMSDGRAVHGSGGIVIKQ